MNDKREIGAIILAAGRGKRMNLAEANKVTLKLADKPIVLHIVEFMHSVSINTVVVVVGHAKESVKEALSSEDVLYAEQTEQLGTGHAAQCALEVLPDHITDVCIVYGDDAVLYTEENRDMIDELFTKHLSSDASFTFLTIEQHEPAGLGRIVRDEEGRLLAIIEEKDATEEQKLIKEINPGCFVFHVDFLKKYLPKVEKSPVTGEYYLTSLIDMAILNGEKVLTVQGGKRKWRGVNTPEELVEAEKLLK
jgi:bifunctional N-acetylglucosamine-1-phosphate-uridyltransferase/glucosamine-1-phosphate-acetyltransferase GlmU-like protein